MLYSFVWALNAISSVIRKVQGASHENKRAEDNAATEAEAGSKSRNVRTHQKRQGTDSPPDPLEP